MSQAPGRVLFLGFGAVAQCALPIFIKHFKMPLDRISVMDFEDRSADMAKWTAQGVKFLRDRVTKENLGSLLGSLLGKGDMLVDLAWNIDCCVILQWCRDNGVLYLNTSVEQWDPYEGADAKHPTERTLYARHMDIRRMISTWTGKSPTAVVEHGANPGLISHFTKQGLLDIASKALAEGKASGAAAERISQNMKDGKFNLLAMNLGVKVIHCSERDTQISDKPKEVDEFVNTWSVEGFREEGTTTSELGWGTHEKLLPDYAYLHNQGPRNQICIARMGMNTWVRTWVPNYRIHGMVVRHGEAFTISDRLTVMDGDRVLYRPTVHYAYCPCDAAIASLQEMRGYGYELQPRIRIMRDEIVSGSDILGALIMGHAYNSWWTGSDLSIEEARKLAPGQNATTLQVAISVVAASMWMAENPERGFHVPDDLPHEFVLKIAKPYLGKFISTPSDWTPLKHETGAFKRFSNPSFDREDPWQFRNFLISEDRI